jgi:hypothetical protein
MVASSESGLIQLSLYLRWRSMEPDIPRLCRAACEDTSRFYAGALCVALCKLGRTGGIVRDTARHRFNVALRCCATDLMRPVD